MGVFRALSPLCLRSLNTDDIHREIWGLKLGHARDVIGTPRVGKGVRYGQRCFIVEMREHLMMVYVSDYLSIVPYRIVILMFVYESLSRHFSCPWW